MIANVLTIAGTDPTGGAGIQADIKAISALGAYAMSAITAVVAQNTQGVRCFTAMDAGLVADQIDAVFEDVRVDAVKIGMVANGEISRVIAERLTLHGARNIVFDPVMIASSGDSLVDRDALRALRDHLIPLATVITPNLPEAATLLKCSNAWTQERLHAAMEELLLMGSKWVLLKGGHLSESDESTDLLLGPDGEPRRYPAPRIDTPNDHGTGCTLSSAIAALLPYFPVPEAVARAKTYLHGALIASHQLSVGEGRGPVHHFHALWPAPLEKAGE
ncbi:bifunctional hydroxymethylpyrimidine kinase/phosphomethylpyrimidine kinase [Pseudooceanicola spongiae]|uniref:hydroxymethylpyrimidine kinase n=1 Tax=Pseudooceanicola spongiae TaxID=2613965 RepID=A0A7L9WIB9_9RHOB|nr:bifunctional hydroxymethylpyrimidine kinase/phosphomethylpyrimidine kinase [Pseudooceanicola spongiae]QOL79643.1 bifunctional hydroxymethylpyrimidine kinase/phosphomethylpyrimidine kinase [Pseudooceanicola spongiae]